MGQKLLVRSVIMLRSNPVAPDSRVEKEARAMFENGYKVTVVAWDRLAIFPREETREFGKIQRIPIVAPFGGGLGNLFNLLKWSTLLLAYLLREKSKYEIIHACDFDTVFPALLMRLLFHKKIVYDIFDFYGDSRNLPFWLRNFVRKIEIWAIGKADAVILPDMSRVEQIKGSEPRKVEFIYNSPEKIQCNSNFIRNNSKLIITYVGLLVRERGLVEMIDIVARHPDWRLNLAGFGSDEEYITQYARKVPNVLLHGRVSYESALVLSCEADVLFATYDPAVQNHRYSSPNKLFEAMMLGKPIIVCEGTGMDVIVKKYGLGFVIKYGDVKSEELALLEICSWDPKRKEEFANKAKAVYEEYFSWRIMKERLISLYEGLDNLL